MDGALFAGFFPHDLMRATAWRFADVQSRQNQPAQLSLLLVDRRKVRGFRLHGAWVDILSSHFKVGAKGLFSLIGDYCFLQVHGRIVV